MTARTQADTTDRTALKWSPRNSDLQQTSSPFRKLLDRLQ